jgi:hypothetical protein
MPDITILDMIGVDSVGLKGLVDDYSFVLKGTDKLIEGDSRVAKFDLGPGSWIVLAKATVRGNSDGKADVRFRLTATGNKGSFEDESWVTVPNLSMATAVLMLGAHFGSGDGQVELRARVESLGGQANSDLRHVVITATNTKKLLLGNLP